MTKVDVSAKTTHLCMHEPNPQFMVLAETSTFAIFRGRNVCAETSWAEMSVCYIHPRIYLPKKRDCSGLVVECLTQNQGPQVQASPASLCCGPLARHIYPSLVLVQPRKTHPHLTKRFLMGCKESNQTKTSPNENFEYGHPNSNALLQSVSNYSIGSRILSNK